MSRFLKISGMVGLVLLLHFGAAFALDVPHAAPESVGCTSCHTLHNSLGSNLTIQATNSALCKSCHTFTGTASTLPFANSDQAKPGISGNSHSWSGLMPAISNPSNIYGLRATADLTNSAVKTRVTGSGNIVICSACHDEHSQLNAPWDPLSVSSSRGQTGTATGGSVSTLVDTSKAWTVNQWVNATVKIMSGPDSGLVRRVTGNTANQLTFQTSFPNPIAANTSYYLNSNRHFMRVVNNADQLCLDCHFYRNQSDVTTYTGTPLSHPINKALAAAKDPSQFFDIPHEPESAGFVPQTGTRGELNGGTDTNFKNNIVLASDLGILCLSCHDMHYTGSSDGFLLRRSLEETCHACHKTDVNTPNDANAIKTHNSTNSSSTKWGADGWGITGGKYGKFGCTTCHTAHSTKNIFLIKENIVAPNSPTDALPGAAADLRQFSGTAGSTPGVLADDTGGHSTSTRACEVCHSRNKYHNYDTANNTGGLDHYNANDCRTCHSHKNGFRPLCDGCHGTPPSLNTIGGPNGLATPATGSTTSGAHYYHAKTVAYPCGWCHYNASGSGVLHKDSKVSLGFVNLFGSKTGGSYNGQASVNYESTDAGTTVSKTGTKTCALYCHGSTMIPNGGTSTNAVWDAGANAYSCSSNPNGSCHGASSSNPPVKGSHPKHVNAALGYGFGCNLCHPAVTSGSHVDGKVSWSFNASDIRTNGGQYKNLSSGNTGTPAPSATYGTCNNLYCHSTGTSSPTYATPEWGNAASALCGSCHGVLAGTPPASPAHAKHVGPVAGYQLACSRCHSSVVNPTTNSTTQPALKSRTLHVNGQGDVQFDSLSTGGTYSNGTCSNTYCHSDGTSVSTGIIPANTTPNWNSGPIGCNGCHGYPPSYPTGSPKANSHLHHNWDCGDCHAGTTPHGDRIWGPGQHTDGVINVQGNGAGGNGFTYTFHKGGGTCSGTAFCHGGPVQWGGGGDWPRGTPGAGIPTALSTTSIRWNFTDVTSNEWGYILSDTNNVSLITLEIPNLDHIDETGLATNTSYTRRVYAYNLRGTSYASANMTGYTLCAPPNVTSDKTTSTWYNTPNVVFTNAAGFGPGGVQYYRYVWDTNPTHTFDNTETQWSSGTLTLAGAIDTGLYLHVKAYNGGNVASGTQDLGPFYYTNYKVYYSVGQNTSDHKTGTPTVTVSGTTAIFSVAQTATNMGVGDVIDYDTDHKKCYISGKTSGTVWSCVSVTGGLPSAATNVTVNSVSHAFSSLPAATQAAKDASHLNTSDLATGNYQLNLPCYYDTGPDSSVTYVDAQVTFTTSAANNVRIYTPTNLLTECNKSQRHQGKWTTTAYSIQSNALQVIGCWTPHIEIAGLQVLQTATAGSSNRGIFTNTGAGSIIKIHDNIIAPQTAYGCNGIFIADQNSGTKSLTIYNNILYNFKGSGTGHAINSDMIGAAYNNTIYNCDYGIYTTKSIIAKNNIVQNSTTGYSGTFDASSVNNISQDATSPNASFRNKTVTFVNAAGNDFHLGTSDTSAMDAGVSLSADPVFAFNTDIDGQSRPYGITWDIGADEYVPNHVFYSVGQNTNDHKTGSPTVTVSGNTATFSVAQTAANMGVGDVVTYGGSNKCYISGKTSPTLWSCVSATGGTPTAATNATVNSITHAYASLSAAVIGASDANHLSTANLVTGNYVLNLPCYYDTGADTTPVNVTGYTTGAANYIKIYTPNNTLTEVNSSQRHIGKWDVQKYSLSGDAKMLQLNASYTQVVGLQVESTGTGDYDWLITNYPSYNASSLTIANSIIRSSNAGISNTGIYFNLANGKNKIYNNIIYDFRNSGIYVDSGNANSVLVYNNTIANCQISGIGNAVSTVMLVKNNVVQGSGSGTGYSGGFAAGSDYNISDQANNAPSPSYRSNQATTVQFIDGAGGDFHLSASDASAIDAGIDLSADANLSFNTDIDAQTRPFGSAWDIGADEFIETVPPTSAISDPVAGAMLGVVDPYTISGSATDNSAVSKVEVSIDGGAWSAATCTGCPGTNVTWTYNWTLPADGSHTIASRATDTANDVETPGAGVTVNIDKTPPTISIGPPSVSAATKGPVTYTVTYTGADTISLTDACVTQNTTGTAGGAVSVTGTGNTRTVTISEIAGDGSIGISISAGTARNNAGMNAAAAGPSATFSVDNTPPSITISDPSVTRTVNGPVTYTVTYSGADAVTLAPGDIILNKTGTSEGTVSVSGSGLTSRTVTISDTTGDGTLGISIAAGSASDNLGNMALFTGPSTTFYATPPTKLVYYSVGQNTNDHKTGSPTITVSGTTATFSVAQSATNMGVGDVVDYDTDHKKCYISGKTSGTVWSCVSVTGQTPTAATNVTVNSISHAFASLAAATSGVGDANHLNTTDLVAGNYILNIPCYYDTGGDGATVTISFNTSKDNYVRIYTPTNTLTECNKSQRHLGKWTNTAYSLQIGFATVINSVRTNFLEIAGLQILTAGYTGYGITTSTISSAAVLKIHDNIVAGTTGGQAGLNIYDEYTGTGGTAYIYNNIVYNFRLIGGSGGFGIIQYLKGPMYNNTVYNCDNGIYTYSYPLLKNNLVQNCTKGYWRLFDAASTNNISQDASSPNAALQNKTAVFANAAGNDFHLAPSDTVAIDAGADLSADSKLAFNTDIDAQTRPTGIAWDIGADEFSDTTAASSTITAPANGAALGLVSPYTISGSATDNVAVTGIEVSTDGGTIWSGAACTGCPGASVTWSYSWSLPADGSYTIKSRATDSSGNVETPGAGAAVTVDQTAPTLSIGSPSASSTRGGPVTYTVNYTGANTVTLATGNITLNKTGTANGTVAVTGSGTASRTVTISGITGDGTLGISIAAGTASDITGNTAASAGPSTTFSVDNTAPTLSIGSPSAGSASSGPITYTVTYSGADTVTLAPANITLNKTGNANGTLSVSGSGTASRTVTISGITGNGTLGISIAAGTASDSTGNSAASAGPSATFNVVNSQPTISIGTPSPATSNTGPVTYTLTYSDATTITLAPGDITLNKSGTANGTVAVGGSGSTTRTVTISGITGNGTLGISIAAGTASDAGGNLALSGGPSDTFVVDNTPPTLSIGSPSANLTNTGPVTYTITYSGADGITLAPGNVTLNKTGTANGTVAVSGTGNTTRTVTVSGITGDGTLGISIASGTGNDIAGNTTAGTGPSTTFNVDNTRPTLSIGTPSTSSTSTGPVTYTVTYSGADNVTLAAGDVILNKTGSADGAVAVSGTGNTTRTVTISAITGVGTLGISIAAGSASDTAGNTTLAGGPSGTFTVSAGLQQVYYSVGQNTNDHKTGSPTVTVSGKTATFSADQTALNMGVGDVVTYGGTNTCYISGKTSQSVWSCISATGGTPVAATDATVNSITHAFASLNAALTGASDANHLNTTNLVTGNYILNIPCYYDTGADITTATVVGYTTGVANYIKIYTPNSTLTEVNRSQRHQGVPANNVYTLQGSFGNSALIIDNNPYVRIVGLHITNWGGNVSYSSGIKLNNNVRYVTVEGNLVHDPAPSTISGGIAVYGSTSGGFKIFNNVVFNTQGGITVDHQASGITSYIYNNTVYGVQYAYTHLGYEAVFRNNIAQNCSSTCFSMYQQTGSDYNIHSDAYNPGGAHDKASTTVSFVDIAGKNFHLAPADTAAKDAGMDLSTDSNLAFNTDIDGQARPIGSAWDIGADEAPDSTAPVSALTAPSDGAVLNNSSPNPYTISGTATDNVAVSQIFVSTDGGNSWNFTSCPGCPGANVTWTYDWTLPADGFYNVKCRAIDLMSNSETAGTGITVAVQRSAPLTYITGPSQSLTNTGPVTYTVNYIGADAITLSPADITLNTTGTATGTVAVSGSGNTSRTVTISGTTGDGSLGISVAAGTATDSSAHPTPSAGPSTTFTVDNTYPTLSIDAPSTSLTRNGPITYTVTYTGSSSVSLAPGDITLNTTGTATGTVAVSGNGNSTRTVTISDITGDGTLGISIAAGTSSDVVGNTAAGSGPSTTFTVDNTTPGMIISAPSPTTTTTGPVTYTVTYSGADTITLAPANITLNGASGSVAVSGTDNITRTVTISGIIGNGAMSITIAAGTASDNAGNLAGGSGPSQTCTVSSGAKAVYYSVGQDTMDHKTGSPTVTVSGTSVTFSVPQTATNMGVGDVIKYLADGDYRDCYISGRTSNSQWSCVSLTGDAPYQATNASVDSIAHAFNGLAAALAGAVDFNHLNTKDLVAGNYQVNIPCYYDSGPDTAGAATPPWLSQWTTSATNCLRIYTPVKSTECNQRQRHNGTWTSTAYTLQNANTNVLYLYRTSFVEVAGLQILATGATAPRGIFVNTITADSVIKVHDNIIHSLNPTGGRGIFTLDSTTGGGAKTHIYNNILYNWQGSGTGNGIRTTMYGAVYNNTVYKADVGIYGTKGAVLKNNIVQQATTNYSWATVPFDASSSNNISDDATSPNAEFQNSFVYFNYASNSLSGGDSTNDFHLFYVDGGVAIDKGISLSADPICPVTRDIDGQSRPYNATWDIGADEYWP